MRKFAQKAMGTNDVKLNKLLRSVRRRIRILARKTQSNTTCSFYKGSSAIQKNLEVHTTSDIKCKKILSTSSSQE
ncbi:hypothetical protein ACSQ67_026176 [Phaseolus vulgaris]